MKVFVTGGHGFIGSRVVRRLVGAGHAVRCLVRATSQTHRIDDLMWERHVGDVRDRASMVAGMRGCEACVHLASVSSWEDIRSDALEDTVIEGTRNLLAEAHEAGVRRVLYVSSATAIDASATPAVYDEESAFSLDDSGLRYAIAKNRAEALCRTAAAAGQEVVIVNPCEVYGPDDDAFVTAGNLRDILRDWPAIGCRGGTAIAHVDDVADGMVAALTRGRSGERYILGGENVSVEQLIRLTLEIGGQNKPVLILPGGLLKGAMALLARLGLPTPVIPEVLDYATLYWFVRSDKAAQELGYSPRPAREVLAPTIAWLQERGHV